MPSRSALLLPAVAAAAAVVGSAAAQDAQPVPRAHLSAAAPLSLPGPIDSNTPLVWIQREGVWELTAINSFAGVTSVAAGPSLDALPPSVPVEFIAHPGHGIWMESVIADDAGVWYGYYHHEMPADVCGRPDRQIPRIGAARSANQGRTWESLGIMLEAPADAVACHSTNRFVMGGVGDVSAVLSHDKQDLYLFFMQYAPGASDQGVAVARLAWADRDSPRGRVSVYQNDVWLPAQRAGEIDRVEADAAAQWHYPTGTPLVAATKPWHDGNQAADAYWGASVHWNTHLEQWVMLVNRARDELFNQDGIYVAFSPTLSDPRAWSRPERLLQGGGWYAQVAGLEHAEGTDKTAGRQARLFITGRSERLITFEK